MKKRIKFLGALLAPVTLVGAAAIAIPLASCSNSNSNPKYQVITTFMKGEESVENNNKISINANESITLVATVQIKNEQGDLQSFDDITYNWSLVKNTEGIALSGATTSSVEVRNNATDSVLNDTLTLSISCPSANVKNQQVGSFELECLINDNTETITQNNVLLIPNLTSDYPADYEAALQKPDAVDATDKMIDINSLLSLDEDNNISYKVTMFNKDTQQLLYCYGSSNQIDGVAVYDTHTAYSDQKEVTIISDDDSVINNSKLADLSRIIINTRGGDISSKTFKDAFQNNSITNIFNTNNVSESGSKITFKITMKPQTSSYPDILPDCDLYFSLTVKKSYFVQ